MPSNPVDHPRPHPDDSQVGGAVMSYPYHMELWDAAQRRGIQQAKEKAVQDYLAGMNTPEGASGCRQAVVSHEGRGSCCARQPAAAFAGMSSARAAVSTTAAAPEKPGTVSLTPHAADGAGLGFDQGALF